MSKSTTGGWSPGATLPREITAGLLGDVDGMARRMTRHIATEIGMPSEFSRVGYLRVVVSACRDALRTLLRLLHDGRAPRPADLERLGSMGAQQAELGVPLEVLLRAYRLAARVVWQEVVGHTTQMYDLPPAVVVTVTAQVLEYLDEISGAVGSAYLATRERKLRQRDRERYRILQRLLAGDATGELRRLAAAADLDLAPPYAVVACQTDGDSAEAALDAVWRQAGSYLVPDEAGLWIALMPPDRDLGALMEAARARIATDDGVLCCGVGPTASRLDDIAPAARRARQALTIGRALHPGRVVHDHAETAVFAALIADSDAVEAFVEATLGTLAEPADSRLDDLRCTLEALVTTNSLADAADRLGVHRHTIVYRSRRLADMGVNMEDPEQRHRLWLALRLRRLGQLWDSEAAKVNSSPLRTATSTGYAVRP